ncbi:hypothetical protein BBJ28_00014608, partial [Nothophytophthora sp. Chile5]
MASPRISVGTAASPVGSAAPFALRRPSDASLGAQTAEPNASAAGSGVMDELLLQYLRSRGYQVSREGGSSSDLARKQSSVGATEDERRRLLGAEAARPEGADLDSFARQLGLTTEACTANHLLFYGLTGGDPTAYDEAYGKLLDWICNSLDMYRSELHAVAFPLFVHCFLELLAKGYTEAGKRFFQRYATDHARLHLEELRTLSLVFAPQHLRENEYVREVLHSKFNVELSLLSFELLNTFLSQERLFLLLAMVNSRVNLVVTSNQPGLQIQQLQDDVAAGDAMVLNNLEPTQQAASGYQTSDELAQAVAASANPSESEIAVPLTTGDYNVDYMVRSAGDSNSTGASASESYTLQDLHAIKVNWGVLPERKVHAISAGDEDAGVTSAATGKEGEGGVANGGAGGASAGGAGASGSTGDASKGGSTVDGDKANAAGGAGASAGSAASTSGAADGGALGAKAGDKAKASGNDKAGANATSHSSADANRKHKRMKLSGDDAAGKKKELLEATGPLPDRKSPFNAEVMEKLVLRVPDEMKTHILEDLRVRAPVSRSALPSALCFTLLNSATHINNMCFSDDVTMVGAACDDASFRVWRNDDQPLGTATGSVYHGSVATADTETEEDERTAVLRGHSSAVYGASFSPDNRFALT